ncbi:acyltransferase [uncultured Cohaesibacter sp.]|uniref:acyltransferase family protein n=1 Tax=uncultured Cohaesibacter sp. TaxID=1002546 RepID=UPI0029C640B1|nr:acyltransferase [uncultured Cohaesibacter sp.]
MKGESRPIFALFAVWRLIAALMVMLYHFCAFGPQAYRDFALSAEVLTALLDLFFIISGFLIWIHYAQRLTSLGSYGVFLLRRLARLYPLHLLTLGIFCFAWLIILVAGLDVELTDYYSLPELLRQLLLVNAWGLSDGLAFNFVSWSLSAEWFCYLTLPVILFIYRKAGLVGLIALLGFCVVALEGLTYLDIIPFPSWLDANTWGAYRVFADFVLGAIIAILASKRLISIERHSYAWGALLLAVIVMLCDFRWGYGNIVAITIALYIAAQVEINAPERSGYLMPLMPLAAVSFGIYMWHPVFTVAILGLGWLMILEPMQIVGFAPVLAFAVIVTITTALLSARFFEAPLRGKILSLGKGSLVNGFSLKRDASEETPLH